MIQYDTPSPDRHTPATDPAAVSMPPHTSIDITAHLPPADSEPTA